MCPGGAGHVIGVATGGVPSYDYEYQGAISVFGEEYYGPMDGNITFVVTDANSCVVQQTFNAHTINGT